MPPSLVRYFGKVGLVASVLLAARPLPGAAPSRRLPGVIRLVVPGGGSLGIAPHREIQDAGHWETATQVPIIKKG